jgi:uncharacterized protein (TIGR02145 family)
MKRLFICMLAFLACESQVTAQTECTNPDVNCDGVIDLDDLLTLLVYFGYVDTNSDGVWEVAVGCVEDECGVCDGPGPQVLAIDSISFSLDSVYVESLNAWEVFQIPDTTFTYVCSNPGCTDPTAINFDPYASEDDGTCMETNPCDSPGTLVHDGHTYELVAIGDQCWFAENLRSEHYANGDVIPGELSASEWTSTDATALGAQAVYNNDSESLADYGRLYNGYSVSDPRGLCPIGWHVPSDAEFMVLEEHLGMLEVEVQSTSWRGVDQGMKMKATIGDSPGWNGNNESGFSGLPAGYRHHNTGNYAVQGSYTYFWTTSPNTVYNWYRGLSSGYTEVERSFTNLRGGFSIRCLLDS